MEAYNVLYHWLIDTNSLPLFFSLYQVSAEIKGLEPAQAMREDRTDEDIVSRHAENVGDMKPAKDDVQLNLAKDCEELKSRLCIMDSKLREVRAPEFKLNSISNFYVKFSSPCASYTLL